MRALCLFVLHTHTHTQSLSVSLSLSLSHTRSLAPSLTRLIGADAGVTVALAVQPERACLPVYLVEYDVE